MNTLRSLNDYGQVAWLDFLSRRFIADGSLKRLIEAASVMAILEQTGISIDEVTVKVLDEGVHLSSDAMDKLLAVISRKRAAPSARSGSPRA